jgi:hypothetical protein
MAISQNQIDAYLAYLLADLRKSHPTSTTTFSASTGGKKFIKVLNNHAAHSFIVLEDDGKFNAGDILKAASWSAPAKNFARGNVINGEYGRISWAGA